MRIASTTRLGLLAVSLALVLGACTAAPQDAPTPNGSQPPAAAPAPSSGPAAAPAPGASADDPLDNGGYAEYTWDDHLKAQREMSGLDSWPEVERIRVVSQEEALAVYAKCMTEQGFPTTLDSDGSASKSYTNDQAEAVALADYICALQYPTDLRYAQALTRTQFRTVYAHYRDELIPCLQQQGYEPSPLPSEETFVENAVGTNAWSPYDDLDIPPAETNTLVQACPLMPPADVLHGG